MNTTLSAPRGNIPRTPVDLSAVIKYFAKHPYFCAFLICLLLNPLYYCSLTYIPENAVEFETFVILLCGFVFFFRHCRQSDSRRKKGAIKIGFVLFMAVVLTGAYFYQTAGQPILWMFLGGSILLFFLYFFLHQSEYRLQWNALLILGMSFLQKIIYVIFTSVYTRQHDVRSFSDDYKGHAGYIQYLLDFHHLPDFDPRTHYQFYHPPLHHTISAVWIGLQKICFGISAETAQESLQTLSLFYAMAIVITGYCILRHFDLKGMALYFPLIIIAFHPTFILFSGSINNDPLSVVWMMGAVLCTLKWYRNQTSTNILKIALCVGLGMMTKLSAAAVAIPIAIVFAVVLFQKIRHRKYKIFGQYGAFLGVCIPLGLWYPLRNYLKFGLPFTYVQQLSTTETQYLGDQSFWSRITDFSLWQFDSVFEQFLSLDENGLLVGYNEKNPLIAVLKNFIFGEYINESIFVPDTWMASIAVLFFWVAFALAVLAFIAMIIVLFLRCEMRSLEKTLLVTFYGVLMISLYCLSESMPFVCSMNSRYITPNVIIPAVCMGICLQKAQHTFPKKVSVLLYSSVGVLTLGFAALSLIVYLYVGIS